MKNILKEQISLVLRKGILSLIFRACFVVIIIVVCDGSQNGLQGKTIYVDETSTATMQDGTSWSKAYNDLQDAIASARMGDTIWVAEGTYYPGNVETDAFELKAEVSIYGGFKSGDAQLSDRDWIQNQTILSGLFASNSKSYHVVRAISLNKFATLDGFIVEDGRANNVHNSNNVGGGIEVRNSKVHIENCLIRNNNASRNGGGIYSESSRVILVNNDIFDNSCTINGGGVFFSSSIVEVNRCRFNRNSSQNGGGGYFDSSSLVRIRKSSFRNGVANISSKGKGGAIYSDQSNIILEDSKLSSNFSIEDGGAIYCTTGTSVKLLSCRGDSNISQMDGGFGFFDLISEVDIQRGSYNYNQAKSHGGCISLKESNLNTDSAYFENNEVDCGVVNCTINEFGGAIYVDLLSKINAYRSGFRFNEANKGGAVYIEGSSPSATDTIWSCTFLQNNAKTFGGGVCSEGRILDFFDVIFDHNRAFSGGGVYLANGSLKVSSSKFLSCEVISNSSTECRGGGIFAMSSSISLDSSRIMECEAISNSNGDSKGGGIYIDQCTLNLDSVFFTLNQAKFGGSLYSSGSSIKETRVSSFRNYALSGGHAYLTTQSSDTIFSSTYQEDTCCLLGGAYCIINANVDLLETNFFNNHCRDLPSITNSQGGAIYFSFGSLNGNRCWFSRNISDKGGALYSLASNSFTNSIFTRNFAENEGGVIYYSGPSNRSSLNYCTVSLNKARNRGGALLSNNSARPSILNSILWEDWAGATGSEIYGSFQFVGFCNVSGGYSGATNLQVDPRFVDPLLDDFNIDCRSPVIDKADTSGSPLVDYNLNPRINGTTSDMGAYENFGRPKEARLSVIDTSSICSGDSFPVEIRIVDGNSPFRVTINNYSDSINSRVDTLYYPANVSEKLRLTQLLDDNNCSAASLKGNWDLVVDPTPIAAFLNGKPKICSGENFTLSVQVSSGTGPFDIFIDQGIGYIIGYQSGDSIPVNPSPFQDTTFSLLSLVDSKGCVLNSYPTLSIFNVTVDSIPKPSFSGLRDTCIDAGTLAMIGNYPVSMSSYKILGNKPGIGGIYFIPSIAGVDTHFVEYTVSTPNGCIGRDTQRVIIEPLPNVVLNIGDSLVSDTIFCSNDDSVRLFGFPEGGTFLGNGVNDTLFYPSNAGAGLNFIYYFYTDSNGCSSVDTQRVWINIGASLGATKDTLFSCLDDTLTLVVAPPGGTFSTLLAGVIQNSGNGQANFFSPLAGPGFHEVFYSLTDNNGCSSSRIIVAEVDSANPALLGGLDSAYCISDSARLLTGIPVGGNFSGPGVNGATFQPQLAGQGGHVISYSVVDSSSGCNRVGSFQTIIHDLPQVSFSGLGLGYCQSDSCVSLIPIPPGGTFSSKGIGAGIVDSFLCPQLSNLGQISVQYFYVDPITGCQNSSVETTTINPVPVVSFQTFSDTLFMCPTETTIVRAHPAGGVFYSTGPGFSDLMIGGRCRINATIAGPGFHTLVYTYTSADLCTNSDTLVVQIAPTQSAIVQGLDNTYCVSDAPVTLTGFPVNGTFSGNGVLNGNTFNPQIAGPGIHTISYTANDNSGCGRSLIVQTRVNPLPTLTINGFDASYCRSTSVDTLFPNPAGGTFFTQDTGTVLSGNKFYPALSTSGPITIQYSYTDVGTGCSNTIVETSDLFDLPLDSIDAHTFSCPDDTINLKGFNATFTGYFSSTFNLIDTVSVSPAEGRFVSTRANAGLHPIWYFYTAPSTGCSNSSSINLEVASRDPAIITGLDSVYCYDHSEVTLVGSPTSNGKFFGPGILGNIFKPSRAGTGKHLIQYTASDGKGCPRSGIDSTYVNALPAISFSGLDSSYCNSILLDTLFPNPTGGIFSANGSGAIISDSILFPSQSPLGKLEIKYKYTSPQTGCRNSILDSTYVNPVPVLSGGQHFSYCIDHGLDTLSHYVLGPSNTNTIFYGSGVTDSSLGIFDPKLVLDTLNYSVTSFIHFVATDTSTACVSSDSFSVEVHPLVPTKILGLMSSYCEDEDSVRLFSTPNLGSLNLQSSYFYIDVDSNRPGNQFSPKDEGAGEHWLVYKILDQNGCSNIDSAFFIIDTLPKLGPIGLGGPYCQSDSGIVLNGNPPGGNWVSQGVVLQDSFFDPSKAVPGRILIQYTYTEPSTGCSNSVSDSTLVHAIPIVSFSPPAPICYKDSLVLAGIPQPVGGSFKGQGIVKDSLGRFRSDSLGIFPYDSSRAFPITYTFVDSNGCVDSAKADVWVYPLPILEISGLDTLGGVCARATPFSFIGFPGGGIFEIETPDSMVPLAGGLFDPGSALFPPGYYQVHYSLRDGNGCFNSVRRGFWVHPLPVAGFQYSGLCNQDTIDFGDLSFLPPADSSKADRDTIVAWAWDFGDGTLDSVQHPHNYYAKAGTYLANLSVQTNHGCGDVYLDTLYVQGPPRPEFKWDYYCSGDDTRFENKSTVTVNAVLDSLFWDFGDGTSVSVGGSDSVLLHRFSGPGRYQGFLKVLTDGGCRDSLTREVLIKPVVTSFPYVQNFDAGDPFFSSGRTTLSGASDSVSWVWGRPGGTKISGAFTGDSCFVTGERSNYSNREDSWVESVCFDFSGLEKGMISFWKAQQLQSSVAEKDLVVLEYSVDTGKHWTVLGNHGEGWGWYDEASATLPGMGTPAWSGPTIAGSWEEARYKLDSVAGARRVLFRFRLYAGASITDEGFAFDSLVIKERERKVLVEYFSDANTYGSQYASFQGSVYALLNMSGYDGEVFGLGHAGSLMNPSPFYQLYQAGPTARSNLYAAPGWDYECVNGYLRDSSWGPWRSSDIDRELLRDASFSVDLIQFNAGGGSPQYQAEAKIRYLGPEDSLRQQCTVYFSLIDLKGDIHAAGYSWVGWGFMPGPAGAYSASLWAKGSEVLVQAALSPSGGMPRDAGVMAFVQNDVSKEVLQVDFMRLNGASTGVSGEAAGADDLGLVVYPNPSSGGFHVSFDGVGVIESLTVSALSGKKVFRSLPRRQKVFVEGEGLADGVYLVSAVVDGRVWTKKVVLRR